jgi:plasmid stabilization system protein ParE
MIVEFLPAAGLELEEAASWYESRVPGLGEEFLVEVERMAGILVERQRVGPKLDRLHRRMALRRFPFALIYRVDSTAVRIVAVAHSRKRPGYWRSRR